MIRTQIYLSAEEKRGLQKLAKTRASSQSELIREAIDEYLRIHTLEAKLQVLRETAGLWKDRTDIDSLYGKLRKETERYPAGGGIGGQVNEE